MAASDAYVLGLSRRARNDLPSVADPSRNGSPNVFGYLSGGGDRRDLGTERIRMSTLFQLATA